MDESSVARPLPPSDEERNGYFYGLPSRPRLVARTSTELWVFQQDQFPIHKRLRTVADHAVVDLWNNSDGPLRQEILAALDGIDWTAVDILRVGYERDNTSSGRSFDSPVTLLISVKPDSTPFNKAYDTVTECLRILEQFLIFDMQVEMKEGDYICCAPYTIETPSLQVPQFSAEPLVAGDRFGAPFSEYLGISIALSERAEHEGTKCLYLRCGNKVYALTCRHVVFPPSEDNKEYRHATDTQRCIIQPGKTTFDKLQQHLGREIESLDASIDLMKLYRNRPDPEADRRQIQNFEAEKDELQNWQATVDAFKDPAARIFGHIAFSPPFSVGLTEYGGKRLRDWALIELDQSKHATPLSLLQNRVVLGASAGNTILRHATGWSQLIRTFSLSGDTALLWGTIPEHKMRDSQTRTPDGDRGLFMIKVGRTTGLTTGIANMVTSVTRRPYQDQVFFSEEWCVIGNNNAPFSKKGDSGSAVFDLQGRVGGMLTGGIGDKLKGIPDTTYVTPIKWLLEDAKVYGYDVQVM